jgi:hypothetical protein
VEGGKGPLTAKAGVAARSFPSVASQIIASVTFPLASNAISTYICHVGGSPPGLRKAVMNAFQDAGGGGF